jgi:hypothetical protein
MLVILGLDQDNREAIAPIIATGLHALVSHNVSPRRKRKTGLVVGLAACRSETPEALSSKQLSCKDLIAVIQ